MQSSCPTAANVPFVPNLKTVFHEYAKKQTDIVVKHGAQTGVFYDMGLQR